MNLGNISDGRSFLGVIWPISPRFRATLVRGRQDHWACMVSLIDLDRNASLDPVFHIGTGFSRTN